MTGFLSAISGGMRLRTLVSMATAIGLLLGLAVGCGQYNVRPGPEALAAADQLVTDIRDYRQTEGVGGASPQKLPLFSAVYHAVRSRYVHRVADTDLVRAASEGMREAYPHPAEASNDQLEVAATRAMLASLDPYSVYLSNEGYRSLNEEIHGAFGGLGVEITKVDGPLKVITPIDGTPAYEAGLKAGDIISHADGEPLEQLTMREAVLLLRGEVGSTVRLTIVRGETAPFDVPVVRGLIQVTPVRWRREGDVGYIRITSFSKGTGNRLLEAITELSAPDDPVDAFVLDLRNNPGGALSEGINVASAFLDGGDVVITRSRHDEDRFQAAAGDVTKGLPLVVLINEGSASASEIVAGAIRDRDRGMLLGAKSYGKGSVQTLLSLPKGRGFKLTTSLYYTPGDTTVEGGIQPNVEIANDDERDGDEQLEEALRLAVDMAGGPKVMWNSGFAQ